MADKEAARRSGRPIVISQCPDVCKTPMGSATPPVPYPVTKDLGDALQISPNVNFTGCPAFILCSRTPDVVGDAPGSAGGVKSGTVGAECRPIAGSSTCNVNGQPVIRHGDRFTMNAGNTIGTLVFVEGGGGAATAPEEDEGFFAWVADTLDAVVAAEEQPADIAIEVAKQHVALFIEVNKQAVGVVVGFATDAWETAEFAYSAVRYADDISWKGYLGDSISSVTGTPPPEWLPSHARGVATTGQILAAGQAICNDPWLIWEGIKKPYADAWGQGHYGEAIGRGIFDIGGFFIGPGTLRVLGKIGEVGSAASKIKELLAAGKLTPEAIEELVKLGKLTPEEAAGAKQALANAGDGVKVTEKLTTAEKAAMGERAAHNKMLGDGYEPVGKTDGVYKDGQRGIDGVYSKPHPPPDYIITEVKSGNGQLSRLADGTKQMGDPWVRQRLAAKVGRAEADKIMTAMENGNVEKWLIRVAPDGSTTTTKIDAAGYLIRGRQ